MKKVLKPQDFVVMNSILKLFYFCLYLLQSCTAETTESSTETKIKTSSRGVGMCVNITKMSHIVTKNQIFAYAKTRAHISLAVSAKLISAFVFATS